MSDLLPVLARIRPRIFTIRKRRVMLDTQLAELYGVKPIRLREQVRRNIDRFPEDFMFQLTAEEAETMVSQNAMPSRRSLGGYLPFVFTQEGIAMLSSVLRSPRAVRANRIRPKNRVAGSDFGRTREQPSSDTANDGQPI